jgi:GTP-binding protein HflX
VILEHDAPRMDTRAWVLHPDIQTDPTAGSPARAGRGRGAGRRAAGLEVVGAEVVRLPRPQPGRFSARARSRSWARFEAEEIELVLIDGPVTPVQQRNLEKAWKVKLLDRTGLILEIFSDRARTREGRAAGGDGRAQLSAHAAGAGLDPPGTQRGGLGFVGGPGETQIEADRRAIDEARARCAAARQGGQDPHPAPRRAQAKVPYPVMALVGYTNAGKSTLFNRLTGAEVMAKDMLFRHARPDDARGELPDGPEVILSDTVGFISDLPTQLVAAFRATLEEVLEADLILHVRDISHPRPRSRRRMCERSSTRLGVAEVWTRRRSSRSGTRSTVRPAPARPARWPPAGSGASRSSRCPTPPPPPRGNRADRPPPCR